MDIAKILLVDDQPENLLSLEAVLDAPGLDLVRASSGADALKHVLDDEFAVILLDVKMPGMDGFETASIIRSRARSRHTPIIFLTAYKSEEELFQGYYTGAVDYLFKPVVPDVLRSKVAAFVDLYKKTQLLKRNAETLEAKNKELERLYETVKQLDVLKTNFFANVSHELRTPLALVLGPVEKLKAEGSLTEEQLRSLDLVERNSRLLLKHVNDLLDIARLDAGKMEPDYVECDLARLVAATAANFEGLAQDRRISFTLQAPEHVPAQVDPEKLQRVLLNILSNAFRFVPDGGAIRCGLEVQDGSAIISVQDNGPGVQESMREAIFERFRQGGREATGSGLGLAIVKEFTQLHGGSVSVSDAPGGGSVFSVKLPLAAPAGAVLRPARPESREMEALSRLTVGEISAATRFNPDRAAELREGKTLPLVLVVEDNPEMNRFLTENLARHYRTVSAFDGEDGWRKALAFRPDLILTDLMMPGMSGEELIRRAGAESELAPIPIVVLTARADPELLNGLLRGGAQDYLLKPFSVAELQARVGNLVAMKRAREALQAELTSQSSNLEEMVVELAFRKRREQGARADAENASRAKDEFLATVSHELRTPITAMLGWSKLLQMGNLDEETTRRALETIERNAKVQAQLIEDILDVSRIITGKLRLNVRPVELPAIVEAAIDAVRPAADAKAIQVETSFEVGSGPVSGDPDRLQQVIWNLLSNAIKFTPREGRVLVRLSRVQSQVELAVEDSGCGISADFLPHVFERFRQADGSTTRTHGGLGLGCAIVRHLVELHGGSVHAQSAGESKGSTFTVKMPLLGVTRSRSQNGGHSAGHGESSGESSNESESRLAGVQVLVVDDEADTREMLTLLLENHGAKVVTVASAAEALKRLRRFWPDVLISDIEMPGEDGYSLIRKVRSLATARGRNLPAAALTAYARPEDRARALSEGYQTHLAKPVEPAELASVVASLAGRHVASATVSQPA